MIRSINNAVVHLPFGNAQHATQYSYGGTVIADGDAEAVGVGSWITTGTVTKEIGGRPGSGGSQVLRVADDGTNGVARQDVLVATRNYRIRGWYRSDGTGLPRIVHNGVFVWTGVVSTSWNYFDFVITAANTDVRLVQYVLNQYVEFDDIFVQELRPQVLDVSGRGLHGLFGDDGLTATEFPTKLTTSAGYNFDGDYFNCGTDSRLAFSETMTFLIACSSDRAYPSDDGTTKYRGLCGRGAGTTAATYSFYVDWYGTNASRTLRLQLSNGTLTIAENVGSFDMRPGEIRTIAAVADGSFLRFFADGELASPPAAQTLNAQTLTNHDFVIGSRFNTTTYNWDGDIYEFAAFDYALPATEIREWHHDSIRNLRNRL